MPNGGLHEVRVGVCPRCRSPRVGTRRQRHRRFLWRCRGCNHVFASPAIGIVIHEEWPNAVLEESIPLLESRARRGTRGRRGPFSGCFLVPILAVAVFGAVGIAVYWTSSSDRRSSTSPSETANASAQPSTVSQPSATSARVTTTAAAGSGQPLQLTPIPVLIRTAVPVNEPTVARTLSAALPMQTPRPTAISTPVPAPTPLPPPNLRHYNEKLYMLELINQARAEAGVPSVGLGGNNAAQLHAESSLEHCVGSHWGIDGLKPYMRYSLASGYQSNGENWLGSDYCITRSDGYRKIRSVEEEIQDGMHWWMNSPGHRRNILDRRHKKVNVGLAWDQFNFNAAQHFEGDYVDYGRLPSIEEETLSLSGLVKNGARLHEKKDLGIQIFFDRPPHALSRGQVSRTYCYGPGVQVASLNYPLAGDRVWMETEFSQTYRQCPDPYEIPADSPAPISPEEAHEFWERAYNSSQSQPEYSIVVPWITASKWTVRADSFSVTADLNAIVAEHGPGVYTVVVWAAIDGERLIVSEYSIFHGIEPPDTYTTEYFK